jgi:hypothetical protein
MHDVLQHKPSTQCPETQSVEAEHVTPLPSLGTHWPVEQNAVETQLASTVQLVRHESVPHTKLPQPTIEGAGQFGSVPAQTAL